MTIEAVGPSGMSTLSSPGWVPLNSAASGAAFAAVLAALVVTVSIQIATRIDRKDPPFLSLRATMPTLVTLLVASYLYIVLAGIPNTQGEISDVVPVSGPQRDEAIRTAASAYAALSARGFVIGGTVLALGAYMALFIVAASIFDNTRKRLSKKTADVRVMQGRFGYREWVLAVMRVGGYVIAFILLFGYAVGANSAQDGGLTTAWWILHTVLLAGPFIAVRVSPGVPKIGALIEKFAVALRSYARPGLIIATLAGMPAVIFVTVITLQLHGGVPLWCFSSGSALYFGLGSASLLHLLQSDNKADREIAVPAAPDEG